MRTLDCDPLPETAGLLSVPPRRPPTAVGAATTPPPPDPYTGRLSRTRRIALALLTIIFAVGALPLMSSPSTERVAAASGLAAASVDVGLQAATGITHPWREIVGPAARRALQQAATLPTRFGKRRGTEPPRLLTPGLEALAAEEESQRRSPNEPA